MSRALVLLGALAFVGVTLVACGGGGGSKATPTPAATERPAAPKLTQSDATRILDAILLKPADMPEGWVVMSDSTVDNAQAAQADPANAGSIDRCGRLLGRTIVNQSPNVVGDFLAGTTLSFFSQGTIYATDAGSADCAAEAATRLAAPGELAKAFGGLFVDPSAVTVTAVPYEAVADGSFAATLSGQVNAAGTIVDLTLLVVAFRDRNVAAVVGSVANGTPTTDELKPYVDKVRSRIDEALGG
jgi:hypothetical protein